MKIFMIQDETGEFSKGGSSAPKFDLRGKFWRSLGFVKSHISQLVPRRKKPCLPIHLTPQVYANCDVVEYELVEVKRTPVTEFYEAHAQKKADERAEAEHRSQEAEEAEERAEYARLQAKFENNP